MTTRSLFLLLALLATSRLQGQAPVRRVPIEGTWRLVAWRIGADTLRAPQVEGVWSVRDGMIAWLIRGTHGDTVLDRTALGRYSADASSFSYEYTSALEVDRMNDGPTIVHDSLPFRGTRAFRLTSKGGEARYSTSDARQVYSVCGDTLTIVQNGLLTRKYVRSGS